MLDSTKAINSLEWHPAYSIKEAIRETVLWYLSYKAKSNEMKNLTLTQIENYVKKAKEMEIPWAHDQ